MKKSLIALSIVALTVSAYAMSKAPADTGTCDAEKACIKDASCCTADGSCKMEKAACPACKEAGQMCPACKAKAEAMKAAEEKTGCTGGVCPLKK